MDTYFLPSSLMKLLLTNAVLLMTVNKLLIPYGTRSYMHICYVRLTYTFDARFCLSKCLNVFWVHRKKKKNYKQISCKPIVQNLFHANRLNSNHNVMLRMDEKTPKSTINIYDEFVFFLIKKAPKKFEMGLQKCKKKKNRFLS